MSAAGTSVLIMAGGTGGHIFPGLALADVLRGQGVEVRWLGAAGGMECERVPAHGIEIDTVQITGLRGKGLLRWLALPFRLARAVREAHRIIGRRRPGCAISFGGYVAGPGGIAAWLRGVPLLVHEQNRIPGLTNRSLAQLARTVLQAFPGAFPARLRPQTCGNPVRESVSQLPEPALRWSGRSGLPRLLVTGGSQGAGALNRLLPEALALLAPALVADVRHQCGQRELELTRQRYASLGVPATTTAFIEDMAEAYAWADLIVCRSGALTVSELAAAGLGAVLIPYPLAVDDHQTANALFLAEAGAAVIEQEAGLTPQRLAEVLGPLLGDRKQNLQMAVRARGLALPQAAQSVATACLQQVAA